MIKSIYSEERHDTKKGEEKAETNELIEQKDQKQSVKECESYCRCEI